MDRIDFVLYPSLFDSSTMIAIVYIIYIYFARPDTLFLFTHVFIVIEIERKSLRLKYWWCWYTRTADC